MVIMSDKVGAVCAQLRSRGIVLPRDNEWLNACVECFVSTSPNHTPNQLLEFVYEQWTLADLADVGAPSLPPSCANCTKMVLTGKYAVQINYFLNVGVPLHRQLLKIRRPEAQKNLEMDIERQEKDKDKVSSSARTLKMEITDGVTTVIGFEDQAIPAIKNPIPGEKAVLSGPIEVRKGVMMLKAANVTMLGGEVDTLLVKNATENLLARALKQPENPDPYGVNPGARDVTVMAVAPRTVQQPPAPSVPAEPSAQRAAPTQNAISAAFDDGEDEALASLAEALENDSFHLEESPINSREPTHRISVNHSQPFRTESSSNIPKPSKASSQKPTKQPSITSYLSQSKKPSSQAFDISSEIDDGFDEDFELMAAQTASLAEQKASMKTNHHDPEALKKQLEATYAGSTYNPRLNPRVGTGSSTEHPVQPDSRQPNKRKDAAQEYDIFGRPKIPRNETDSPTSSGFKNPRHAQSELMDTEELYEWLPPPPKANLDHVRPSHEKGKILVDYTDSATLDLDSVSTQKTLSNPKIQPIIPLDEPFPPKEYPCSRKIFGRVIKVVNKLQLRDAKWILSAIVEAKGIELEMDFSPEALDKIFVVTAEEITRQKEQLKKNPELKEKFNGHLRESQKRIQTLNCEMTIHFKNFISKPVVLDVSKND